MYINNGVLEVLIITIYPTVSKENLFYFLRLVHIKHNSNRLKAHCRILLKFYISLFYIPNIFLLANHWICDRATQFLSY